MASPAEAVERLYNLQESYTVSCDNKVADLASAQTAPPHYSDVLHTHQQAALGKLLSSLDRQVLALSPGSGKTAVCCVLASVLPSLKNDGPAVFCVPKTLVGHWASSLLRFSPGLTVKAPSTGVQTLRDLSSSRDTAVVLTPALLRHTRGCSPSLFVVDEAHKMVAGSVTFKNVAQCADRSSRSVFVTATPESSASARKRLSRLVTGRYFSSDEESWARSMGPYVVSAETPNLPDVKFSLVNLRPSESDVACSALSIDNVTKSRAVMESSPSPSSRVLYQRSVLADRVSKATPSLLLTPDVCLGAKETYIIQSARISPVLVTLGSVQAAKLLSERLAGVIDGVVNVSALDRRNRTKALDDVKKDARVIVLPDEMMLGINLPGIKKIIHADVPPSRSVLIQRSARSSRIDSELDSVECVFLLIDDTSEGEALLTVAPDIVRSSKSA